MKYIVLRTEPLDTKALLVNAIENSPQKALTIKEIRDRGKVLDLLEAHDGYDPFPVEDYDYGIIMQALNAVPWRTASKDLRQFLDDVEHAPCAPALPAESSADGLVSGVLVVPAEVLERGHIPRWER